VEYGVPQIVNCDNFPFWFGVDSRARAYGALWPSWIGIREDCGSPHLRSVNPTFRSLATSLVTPSPMAAIFDTMRLFRTGIVLGLLALTADANPQASGTLIILAYNSDCQR
jgi:hypothetical protein